MDYRTTAAHKFRILEFRRLEFKQYDIILTKEHSVLAKSKSSFEGENIQTQYSVLGCSIDICFHDNKLTIVIDENRHRDRNIDHEIKRQKVIEQKLSCESV